MSKHIQIFLGVTLLERPLHGVDEVIASDSLSIMAPEVFVHAGAKPLLAQQGMHHADDLGSLFVDRCRIEIADFLIAFGPNRMRHRTAVLRELMRPQHHHIIDALDGTSALGCPV